jgi:hypothetical protein
MHRDDARIINEELIFYTIVRVMKLALHDIGLLDVYGRRYTPDLMSYVTHGRVDRDKPSLNSHQLELQDSFDLGGRLYKGRQPLGKGGRQEARRTNTPPKT